jgi:hypothetical protein
VECGYLGEITVGKSQLFVNPSANS